jgi:hypothetical protein
LKECDTSFVDPGGVFGVAGVTKEVQELVELRVERAKTDEQIFATTKNCGDATHLNEAFTFPSSADSISTFDTRGSGEAEPCECTENQQTMSGASDARTMCQPIPADGLPKSWLLK